MKKISATQSNTGLLYFMPIVIGLVFFAFNAWFNHKFYHVNSYKMVFMAIAMAIVFIIYDVAIANTRRDYRAFNPFPWKEAMLFLLPVLATLPGYFLHIGSAVHYNFNYELATRLIILLWVVYIVRFLKSDTAIITFLSIVGATMLYVWLLALLERSGTTSFLILGAEGRVKATYGNVNYLAGALIPTLPLLFCLFLPKINIKERRAALIFKTKATHIWFFIFFLVTVHTFFLTKSRSAFAASIISMTLAAILLLYSATSPANRKKFMVWLIVILVIAGPLALMLLYFIDQRFRTTNRLFEIFGADVWKLRIYVWEAALNAFKESPIFGYGLGVSYALYFKHVRPDSRVFYPDRSYNHAHSEWLEYLTEGGLFGYIFFFILWGYVFINIMRIIKHEHTSTFHKRLAIGTISGMVGFYAHGIFSVAQRMIVTNVPQFALLGVAFALIAMNREHIHRESPRKFANILDRWQTVWVKAPYFLKHRLPPFLILVVIAILFIPWARGQNQYIQIVSRGQNQGNIQTLKNLTDKRKDIYALYHLLQWQVGSGALPDAINTAGVIENTIPYYRDTKYIESLVYYQTNQLDKAEQAIATFLMRDSYHFPSLAINSRITARVNNPQKYVENLGRIASFRNWIERDRSYYRFNFLVEDQTSNIRIVESDDKSGATVILSMQYFQQIIFPLVQQEAILRNENFRESTISILLSSLSTELTKSAFQGDYISIIPIDDSNATQSAITQFQNEIIMFGLGADDALQSHSAATAIKNWDEVYKQLRHIQIFLNNYGSIFAS